MKYLVAFVPYVLIIIFVKDQPILSFALVVTYSVILIVLSLEGIFKTLAGIAYKKGKMEKTLKWYKRASSLKRSSNQTKSIYGYLLLKGEKPIEAEEILKNLLDAKLSDKDRASVLANYALIMWKLGKPEEGVKYLNESIAIEVLVTSYESLGYLMNIASSPQEALAFNIKADEYSPKNPIIMDNLGQAYMINDMYDEAQKIYEELVIKKPSFPDAYYNYGLLLSKLDKNDESLDMLRRAKNYKFTYLNTINLKMIDEKIIEIETMIDN